METHIVPVVRQWKHIVNAQSACRVTTPTDDGSLPLVVLPNGGSATFCTNSREVHVETDGLFEIVPFEHTPQLADQSYTPDSLNPQSGTAVAGALALGSLIESFPDTPPPYTLKQGATVQLTEYTDTLQLTPSALTTAQEMRVLYSPAEARKTPLIAVPQGVTLHWAGDAEPTWEVGKDYVIQLLQTAPTHLEARLFNAPQGAKLPEWLTDAARYVAWVYDAKGNHTPVAAKVTGQLHGDFQFAWGQTAQYIGGALSDLLADETFAEEITAEMQFAYIKDTLYLPKATFAKVTSAESMFQATEKVILPQATFASLGSSFYLTNVSGSFYMPRATFKSNTTTYAWFTGTNKKKVYLNAFNTNSTQISQGFSTSNYDESESHFYSWAITRFVVDDSHGMVFLPSATWNALTNCSKFKNLRKIYCPRLNLRAATSAANFWRGHGGISLEELRQVVYGPKLVDNGEGGLKMSATTYTENGIVQMIAPPEHKRTENVYTPLVGEPLYTYDWGDHLYEYIEGERLLSNGNKPTGWGIQDFRVTDAATGEFVLDGAGDYTYKSTGHTIAFDVPAAAEGNADYEACYSELETRGWDVLITNV